MFQPGSLVGSTYFASKEPVRDPVALQLVSTLRSLASKEPSMKGSASLRRPYGQLISGDVTFGTIVENNLLELKDYDPVRKTSIVIGLNEPSVYVALHWLALRTHPGSNVSLVLYSESPQKGVPVFRSRLLHGSFDEAMEIVKAMKAAGTTRIFLDGIGLLLLSKDLKHLSKDLRATLGKIPKKDKKVPPKKKGRKKVQKKGKPRRSKPKTHYKRGPTRRGSNKR